jgi:hypothetical protein
LRFVLVSEIEVAHEATDRVATSGRIRAPAKILHDDESE